MHQKLRWSGSQNQKFLEACRQHAKEPLSATVKMFVGSAYRMLTFGATGHSMMFKSLSDIR
jgi:hypothetical protein